VVWTILFFLLVALGGALFFAGKTTEKHHTLREKMDAQTKADQMRRNIHDRLRRDPDYARRVREYFRR
tara:strand:- start:2305 stop:2508 length:204 start_codon:yes stop_codon:yes gene_type:complete